MRMRVTLEIDVRIKESDEDVARKHFADMMRRRFNDGSLHRLFPGELVYVATEIADSEVISHDGRIVTNPNMKI